MSELIARAWIGRQHGLSDTAIRKRAKANGWTRDLSGAVRSRVREGLVRANLLAGVTPSEAAIVDAAAVRGVEVVRSHRRDIDALREAVAVLLADLASGGPEVGTIGGQPVFKPLKVTERLIKEPRP